MDGNKKHYVWGGPKEWSFGGASDFDVPFYTFSNFFEDNQVEKVIEIIKSSAYSGKIGDGKIFVSNIEQVIRIRTGEKDSEAV